MEEFRRPRLRRGEKKSTDEYLLGEFTIAPPLEEFRRLFEKRLRSFETSEDPQKTELYRKAFTLGEEKIARIMEEGEKC